MSADDNQENNMRPIALAAAAIWLAAVVTGCGDQERNDTAREASKTTTGMKAAADAKPCGILSEDLLRAHFEIGADVPITRTPSKYSPHPLCSVSWPKPNAAEIEQQNAAAMSDYMQRKMSGEDVKMPSFRTSDEVSLTLYRPVSDSPERAIAAFDGAMKILSDGITRSHQGVEVTFQADLTPVDGVGDKAMWAAKMRQLSVVHGVQIFHLTVNTGADNAAELAKAKAIATDVADELG